MRKLLEQCPACGGRLVITGICCESCSTEVRGRFAPGKLSSLTEEQLTFVQIFLRSRGNLSEVEKVLGISYPTIRNKLDEIIKVLNRDQVDVPTGPDVEAERRTVLAHVASGAISPAEGLERLRNLKGA